jgi:hypothetical protein
MDWKKEIVVAHLVKQKIAEVDVDALWEHHYPRVAASEEVIADAECKLKCALNAEHKSFLAHANGWDCFYQAVDLFGTEDLVAGPKLNRAMELLESLEDTRPLCGLDASQMKPIAVSRDDIDLFTVALPGSTKPGFVFWFAGSLIDEFPSFSEWFLAMVDYNRLEYQRLTGTK